MSDTIKINGITFECEWSADEDYAGNSFVVLEGVKIGDQNITDIISDEFWERIEKELEKQLEDDIAEMKAGI